MEAIKDKSALSHENPVTLTAGYIMPETAYLKIKSIKSQLRLLSELTSRPSEEQIVITSDALEETLTLIELELGRALNEAEFFSR